MPNDEVRWMRGVCASSFNGKPKATASARGSHAVAFGLPLTSAGAARNPNHLTTDDTDDTNKKHP